MLWSGGRRRLRGEAGSAVVDFALIGGLLTVIFLAVVQLMLVLHVRNTLIDAAASGARYGTLADRSPEDAGQRTTELITAGVGEDFASDVTVQRSGAAGAQFVEVVVRAPLPVVGLLGPAGVLEVQGRAILPS
ncbi:TadE/TadG family type IV pilus assembly protein [uncultured Arthrobacter sp.]|uniref:TadE/TadG family type IV pilus assembly protein n=1 Tax=uncultured Arthrobacter sp. TaxID=114050 RepID=UPI0025DAB3CA|nr:TadE family protein [uncultured Arthrobacter sp.]